MGTSNAQGPALPESRRMLQGGGRPARQVLPEQPAQRPAGPVGSAGRTRYRAGPFQAHERARVMPRQREWYRRELCDGNKDFVTWTTGGEGFFLSPQLRLRVAGEL